MTTIYFAPGLKPVLKHQEHDQQTHGSWATGSSESDYEMSHRPSLGSGTEGDMDGASLDNVSNGIYPDDVYSPRGVQIYGTGYKELDKQAHAFIMEYRGKPEKSITIYRAIPKDASTSKISGGEWVTPIKQYAVQHGQSNLNDDYQILTREVKAKEIFTSGDSWLEWGYAPSTVQKHQEHDQSTHGNWADSGSPKLTIMGQNDGANEFFNEDTRVVRYQPEGKQPTDYVLYIYGLKGDTVYAIKKPTDGTTIDGWSSKSNRGVVGHLDITRMQGNPWRRNSQDGKSTIVEVAVSKPHQRRGLATAMLRFHRDMFPEQDLQHSDALLPDGQAWADVVKHGNHDQSTHGNWADGSQGSVSELSDSDIQDILQNTKTVEGMYQKVAERLGKTLKPKVEVIPEGKENLYRGMNNLERDAEQLVNGKIPFTPLQTWGQGIYATPDKQEAGSYGQVVRMKLDSKAKIVTGEPEPFFVDTTGTSFKSDFIDFPKLLPKIKSGEMDNFSISDAYNIYRAAKGYDGYQPHGREIVLFNGTHLTVNRTDIGTAVQKHQEHDQSTHGSWATGVGSIDDIDGELKELSRSWSKKYRELENYLESKGMTGTWQEVEGDPIAKKLRAEGDALEDKRRSKVQNFYDTYFTQNEGENFDALRGKYVVADKPTLKMNKQLREGGGLTQRVKDADKLVSMGVVKQEVGVYRGAILPKELINTIKVGTSFTDKGFQSTDVSKESAEFYARVRKENGAQGEFVLFRYTLKKGLNAVDVHYGEIVVQRNAKITVTKKTKSGEYTIIDATVDK